MGRKSQYQRRRGRHTRQVNMERRRKQRRAEREANNAFYHVYREIRDGGNPTGDDNIAPTGAHDETNTQTPEIRQEATK